MLNRRCDDGKRSRRFDFKIKHLEELRKQPSEKMARLSGGYSKPSNKPKRKEWITDYFLQLGAYAMGHNTVYGTKIDRGVVLMCTKDNLFQRFEVEGQEFVNYQHDFLRRVDQYYKNKA